MINALDLSEISRSAFIVNEHAHALLQAVMKANVYFKSTDIQPSEKELAALAEVCMQFRKELGPMVDRIDNFNAEIQAVTRKHLGKSTVGD